MYCIVLGVSISKVSINLSIVEDLHGGSVIQCVFTCASACVYVYTCVYF